VTWTLNKSLQYFLVRRLFRTSIRLSSFKKPFLKQHNFSIHLKTEVVHKYIQAYSDNPPTDNPPTDNLPSYDNLPTDDPPTDYPSTTTIRVRRQKRGMQLLVFPVLIFMQL
jgi:hypothetical protein